MKALCWHGKEDVRVDTVPDPQDRGPWRRDREGSLHRRRRLPLPYADLAGPENDRRQSAIPDLFIVDLVARYVAWKLSLLSET